MANQEIIFSILFGYSLSKVHFTINKNTVPQAIQPVFTKMFPFLTFLHHLRQVFIRSFLKTYKHNYCKHTLNTLKLKIYSQYLI